MPSNRPDPPSARAIISTMPVLNVGGHPITITIKDIGIARDIDVYGMYIDQMGEIVLDGRQTDCQLVNTLLHEVLHAVIHTSGVDLPDGVEEVTVRVITSHLFATFMSNPRLAGLIAACALRSAAVLDRGVCAICDTLSATEPPPSGGAGQAGEAASADPGDLPVDIRAGSPPDTADIRG